MGDLINKLEETFESDGSVDYISLSTWLTNIKELMGVITGLLAYLIVIGLSLIMVLEILYINIPIFRNSIDEKLQSDIGDKRRKRVLGLVLRDAIYVVNRANTVSTGKNVNYMYLGVKLKYIVVMIFVLSVVLDGASGVVKLLLKIAKSIIDAFSILN
ncbi:MAG: hypothetical protein QXD03_02515 [Candidatus Anstonellales archaeon]